MTKKTKPTKKQNVCQKIQQVRVDLVNKNLKKTGNNTYSKFTYYELGDFLPTLNELNNKVGLMTKFTIKRKTARLDIFDCDNMEHIISFHAPTATVEIGKKKDGTGGAEPIQNLGGQITYMRRYLLMMAYEIVESDYVDRKKQSEVKELPEKYVKQIYGVNDLLKLNTLCKDIQKETKMKYQKSLLEIYTLKKEELTTKEENATS